MKVARLVCAVLAVSLVAGWATAFACDDSKSARVKASAAASKDARATTAASGTACSASMAATCPPELAAACKASMAAGGPDLCTGKARATPAVAAKAHAECCMGGQASAVTAMSHGACPYAGSTTAVTAIHAEHCAGAKASAAVYGASSCGARGARFTAAAEGHCNGHGMTAMASNSAHQDCDACADMVDCSGALDAAGAHRQTVRLKNGVMYVYTADSPRSVSAVQAAVARRVDRMARLASAGDKAHLCDECKQMRGAMASGKLSREVINIEGGSLTLVTSSDPALVAKLHAMADDKLATRVKL